MGITCRCIRQPLHTAVTALCRSCRVAAMCRSSRCLCVTYTHTSTHTHAHANTHTCTLSRNLSDKDGDLVPARGSGDPAYLRVASKCLITDDRYRGKNLKLPCVCLVLFLLTLCVYVWMYAKKMSALSACQHCQHVRRTFDRCAAGVPGVCMGVRMGVYEHLPTRQQNLIALDHPPGTLHAYVHPHAHRPDQQSPQKLHPCLVSPALEISVTRDSDRHARAPGSRLRPLVGRGFAVTDGGPERRCFRAA